MSTPGRSLIAAEYLPPERDGQVRVLLTCDCGTATDLTVEVEGDFGPGGKGEAAVTCEGCHTVHWFTVTATQGRDISDEEKTNDH